MDTSKEYIKMCDCPEIQSYKRTLDFCDYYAYYQLDFWQTTNFTCGSSLLGKGNIWLPRQDQLQEMVKYAYKDIKIEVDIKLNRFWNWYREMQVKIKGSHPFASMEQLWLAFVMKEKYNKIWDGKEWRTK